LDMLVLANGQRAAGSLERHARCARRP